MNDNPPDPALEIRSIWNLHVYGNGWSDIGYNFLVDQYGNVYQGRYNPWLDTTDVWGAHAGEANSKSVGICLLGTFGGPAAISPAAAAATGLERTIGWRFSQRSVDPFGSAPIVAFQSLPDR